MKEQLMAFRKDKEYRLSILSFILAMFFFMLFFYILRQKVIDKTNIIPLLFSMAGTIIFMTSCAIYLSKSRTITSWMLEQSKQDPKQKVMRFAVIAGIICLISYLFGYGSSRIIMNSTFIIIFYAIFVFQFQSKRPKSR